MRNWLAEKLETLAFKIRGEGPEWGALVSGGEMIIRKGQPIHLTVAKGSTWSVHIDPPGSTINIQSNSNAE